jgi:hypothetical protein
MTKRKGRNLQRLIFSNYVEENQPSHVPDVIWGFIQKNREEIRAKQDFVWEAWKGTSFDEVVRRKTQVLREITGMLHAYIEENVQIEERQAWFDRVNQDHQEMLTA